MQDWGFIASIENFVSEIPNLAYTRPLAAIIGMKPLRNNIWLYFEDYSTYQSAFQRVHLQSISFQTYLFQIACSSLSIFSASY